MHASVIIPTKNPGPVFKQVVTAVVDQEAPFDFELVVVDSGSSDGTVEYIRKLGNVRLLQIPPESFGHGRTRNYAAAQSTGDFVAFLTHDAIPASRDWLANLVGAVEQSPDIAGAFGRHIAHKTANDFTRRNLDAHFAGFLHHPLVVSRAMDPQRYAADEGWRQLLHFYSDNNSCLRRSVWEKFPYPDVDFAEDQIWAKTIIEAGYSKAYAPDAIVEHSHEYGFTSQLRRAFDEAHAFQKLFGYRLGAGIKHMVRSFLALTRRDLRYAWSSNPGILATIGQVARNGALVAGHFLGTHANRLPARVKEYLSHDKRLLNSLRTAVPYS